MKTVVIEHVKVTDLPEAWRLRLGAAANAKVTVRIEEEAADHEPGKDEIDDPLFEMWREREDMADMEAHARKLRFPRF